MICYFVHIRSITSFITYLVRRRLSLKSFNSIMVSRMGPVITGLAVGILAPVLVLLGNPGNMGICVACFERDIAGALGFHRAAIVQYIRPEIIGLILGAFASAIVFKEFKPRAGSAPAVRFLLGIFASIGALIFLGCPWRAYLRLAGGDYNALFGIAGLFVGILIGIYFISSGYNLGRSYPAPAEAKATGFALPVVAIILLALLVIAPKFGAEGAGPIFFSTSGPGSQHAPWYIGLIVMLIIGWLAQRSRFCTIGALRDLVLAHDAYLFWGIVALLVAAGGMNYALGAFKPGFVGQPVAHTNSLWNFLGMVLSGLCFTLAGGCPGRQLIMAGEGDGDAAMFVFGMITGAAVAHNFGFASSGSGIGAHGPAGFVVGMIFCLCVGFTMRRKA